MEPQRYLQALRASKRGQAAVEAAFALPFLFLLVMGVIDLGRMIYADIALQEATQEGAIFAAYHADAADVADQVEARITESSSSPWITGATVTVTPCPLAEGDPITVTTTYNLDLMTPVISDLLGSPVQLSESVVATNFAGDC